MSMNWITLTLPVLITGVALFPQVVRESAFVSRLVA
jgi:hypothetical protein